jgi:hypothetical protein
MYLHKADGVPIVPAIEHEGVEEVRSLSENSRIGYRHGIIWHLDLIIQEKRK